MGCWERTKYSPVQHDEDTEAVEPETLGQCRAFFVSPTTAHFVLVFLVACVSFAAGIILASDMRTVGRAWKQLHVPSPIADDIALQANIRGLDGRLTGQDQNIFAQPPSPDVDAAWGNLSSYNYVWITSQDLKRIGKDPSVSARIPIEYGLGTDAYAAAVDVGHKIHCLDRLRQEIHFEHYFGDLFPDGKVSELHQHHTTHCLYILLQSLMCDASTDVTPFLWYENNEMAFQDFVVNRKCGNFDGVFEWAKERALPLSPFDIKKPENQGTVGPMDKQLLRMLRGKDNL